MTDTTQPVDLTSEDRDALERLVTASAAIETEWSWGARQVEKLQRQAERVRDDVRERTAVLERQQADAVLELYRSRSVEGLAQLLGMSLDDTVRAVREAEERVTPGVPRQRTE
jgi:hypothetical protein